MANFNDLFNVVQPDSQEEGPENTLIDKAQAMQQRLKKMQTKLVEANQPKVRDVVNSKLKELSGQNEAQQSLVFKTADNAIQKLINPVEQSPVEETQGDAQGQQVAQKKNIPTGRTAQTTIQKSLITSNTILNDAITLYNNFNPDYFTYGSRIGLAGQQLAEKVLGEGEYFKDPEAAKKQSAYFQRAQTAFFNWVKEQSGAQVSDAEMKRRLKARFNPSMSPSEAKGALLNMMQEVITHRLALKGLLKEGFVVDGNVDHKRMKKLIDAQKKLQGPQLEKYIKNFMDNPQNKKAGATKMDAMMYYMHKHGLLGSGGNNAPE